MSANPSELPDEPIGEPVVPLPEDDEQAESAGGNDDPPEDESPFEKTYMAIDGVTPDDLGEANVERLEQRVIEILLTELGAPITDVRVLDKDETAIVEVDMDNGE